MKRTDTIIIGGGQAGLAMSRCLSDLSIDHVVLERGRIAQRWRTDSWDSLRLLTPNWQSRLPGWRYRGPDPDAFMTAPDVVEYLQQYARASAAPVAEETTVLSVGPGSSGYRVSTTNGVWEADNVVIATGHNQHPQRPGFASELSPNLQQIAPSRYRNPNDLPDGGVLVVGASATGIQLADEIQRSGRPVTLAVGRHTRVPRQYRGVDIMWWLDRTGAFDRRVAPTADTNQPSMQLIGSPDQRSIDLNALQNNGVRLVGRARAANGQCVSFDDDLAAVTAAADEKMARILSRIDRFAERHDLGEHLPDGETFEPVRPAPSPKSLDLAAEGIESVIWATGFRRSYPWLHVPVIDGRGEIRHSGGVTDAPGLYVLGLQYLRRPGSSFIDGVGDDARALSYHISSRLHGVFAAAA
jgi:putative flavoprotein involved in K+ transport